MASKKVRKRVGASERVQNWDLIEDAIAGASVRNNILRSLKTIGPCTYVQLATITGSGYDHVTNTCYRLRDDGLVEIKTAKSRITGKRMMVVRLRKDTE